MLGRNILKPRPPSSPNKPPPAPARTQPKGTPIPINANFLITGSALTGRGTLEHNPKNSRSKHRPQSATVNKNIIKTLQRSPSVDNSFYDRFERLDRDWVEGDKAFKEKGGRIKTDRNDNSKTQQAQTSRSKSTSAKHGNTGVNKHNTERFLDLAMIYDEEGLDDNNKNTRKKRNKSATISRQDRENRSRKRPSTSSHKSRERSISRKRSERSDSKGVASVGSGSRCSSRSGSHRNRRGRGRKSRSRTRRETPRYNSYGSTSRNSPERKPSLVRNSTNDRVISASVVKLNPDRRKLENERVQSANVVNLSADRKPVYVGTLSKRRVLSANVVKLRVDLKQLRDDDHPCVNAGLIRGSSENVSGKQRERKSSSATSYRKISQEVHRETNVVDNVTSSEKERRISSIVPKLKMMVAPTATPTFFKSLSLKTSLTNMGRKRNV